MAQPTPSNNTKALATSKPATQTKAPPPAARPRTPADNRFMARVQSAAVSAPARSSAPRSLVATDRAQPDSLGSILGKNVNPMGAAFVAGLVDRSDFGKRVKDMTGFLRASDAAMIVGGLVRLAGVDNGMPTLRKANTAFLTQQSNDLARNLGGSAHDLAQTFFAKKDADKSEAPVASNDAAPESARQTSTKLAAVAG